MGLRTIPDRIDLGSMAPPESPCGYVWDRDQVRGLMQSLYRKLPVGSRSSGRPAPRTPGPAATGGATWPRRLAPSSRGGSPRCGPARAIDHRAGPAGSPSSPLEHLADWCASLTCGFKRQYNELWLIERHGFRTPRRVRIDLAAGSKGLERAGRECRKWGESPTRGLAPVPSRIRVPTSPQMAEHPPGAAIPDDPLESRRRGGTPRLAAWPAGTGRNSAGPTGVPLYAYIRRRGQRPRPRPQHLTQDLFAPGCWRGRPRPQAEPARGRFPRLPTAHLRPVSWPTERDRGGDAEAGRAADPHRADRSRDEAEGRYVREPAHGLTPERIFDRTWALILLGRVLERLREEYRVAGQSVSFEVLSPALTEGPRAVAYATLAARLGTTEGAVRVAVHRLRRRYGERLREEIAATVDDPAEVDDEIRALFVALDVTLRKSPTGAVTFRGVCLIPGIDADRPAGRARPARKAGPNLVALEDQQ